LSSYAAAIQDEQKRADTFKSAPHVALIFAIGDISSGSKDAESSTHAGLLSGFDGSGIRGDDLAAAVREAAKDKDIQYIVMRVNSPGGSPTASETIRRAIMYAKAHGKKVYVSMGTAAASGGYWISSAADRIYALPMTLTGSIGVAGGKFVLQDLWKKLGVSWDGVGVGKNAALQSFNTPYNDSQRAGMNKMFDHIYHDFVTRVAEGRHMTYDQVDKIAQGRVWSGNQGKALGLVDRIGGLDVAMNDVAQELHVKDRFHLNVEVLPKPESPIERIARLLQNRVAIADGIKVQMKALRLLEPFLRFLGVEAAPGIHAYEPLWVR
jgi:protease-4